MGIWLDKEDAGGVQGSTNIVESDGWKSSFATNMKHVETIYSELPSLNVIRATALVGAMRKTAQDSGGVCIVNKIARYFVRSFGS